MIKISTQYSADVELKHHRAEDKITVLKSQLELCDIINRSILKEGFEKSKDTGYFGLSGFSAHYNRDANYISVYSRKPKRGAQESVPFSFKLEVNDSSVKIRNDLIKLIDGLVNTIDNYKIDS